MANERIFGLAVPLSLADVPDGDEALANLGLNIDDLEVIRDISSAGFDGNDLQTLSNLNNPIWQTFDRYIRDVLTYNTTLANSSGSDFRARGNLEVSGDISASAFRYTLLDGFAAPKVLRWGDISTSRVSSWSSIGNAITYGSDVKIAGSISAGELKTRITPTERTFSSEVPTHVIRLEINGVDRFVYAMKGIPITFKGFFRNADITLQFLNTGSRNSFRVYELSGTTPINIQDFPDLGNFTSSTLQYRGINASTRVVESYINPEQVTDIIINDCNLQELPKSRFTLLETISLQNNGIVDFPDFQFLAPALRSLNVSNNPFYNAGNAELRYFSDEIRDLLPDTIQTLTIPGCFKGSFNVNALDKFESLSTITVSRGIGNTFFGPDSNNPSGAVPNFYGQTSGDPEDLTKRITSVTFVDQDFRTFDPGSQGGISTEDNSLTITNGGNGYGGGATGDFQGIPLTQGPNTSALATVTVAGGVISAIKITSPGTGYTTGSFTIDNNAIPGGTATGAFAGEINTLIYTINLKEQPKLVSLNLSSNNNLVDSGFSLNCPSTLQTINTTYTQLSIANCSNFTALRTYEARFSSGRGSLWTGWDGTFGGSNYPITDGDGFKFANCGALQSFNPDYSDIVGYLPRFVNCPNLTRYDFYSCNNLVAGRPGKRKILSLYSAGGILQLGAFSLQQPNPNYRPNTTFEVTDTGENSNPTVFAVLRVTINPGGDGVSDVQIVNPGSGYQVFDQVTIDGSDLGARGNNRGLFFDIDQVEEGIIAPGPYDDGVYPGLLDTRANTAVGRNATVDVEVSGGSIVSYTLGSPGQDYQDDEFVTVDVPGGGSTSPLQVKIFEAEKPKILYNDQFSPENAISRVDIRVINPNMAGEIESQAFLPVRDTLTFLRLEFGGRAEGDFPFLDDQVALQEIISTGEGWTGPVPAFSSALSLREIYLNNNNFTGTLLYTNKINLDYINYNDNNITFISNSNDLPNLEYLYLANNNLSGTLPQLDISFPNVEYVQLNGNEYNNYTNGLAGLLQIKQLDLSQNQMPTAVVDNILFDMVDNYQTSQRSGVLVNLQGGQMGAPTPYPIIEGILSTISPTAQATIAAGSISDLGSIVGFSAGSVPVSGTYTNLTTNGSVNGESGLVTVDVDVQFLDTPVTSINTTPSIVAGTLGEIKTIPGSFDNGSGTNGTYNNGTFTLDDFTPPAGGTAARVQIIIDGTGFVDSVTLIDGGSGYTAQGTPDIITIQDGVFNNSGFTVDIGTVTEFVNGTYTRTDNNAPGGGVAASVDVTVTNGSISSTTLTTNPSGEGYTTSDTIDVSIPATGDWDVPNNASYAVTGITDEYYNSITYTTSINTGGRNYLPGETLTTFGGILMRKTDGSNEFANFEIDVDTVTQRTNTSVFTGFAAVEFLRSKGWSIQVES